ncbi:MAG: alpha/beta fold hydrolase [Actinomycetes bacterium]
MSDVSSVNPARTRSRTVVALVLAFAVALAALLLTGARPPDPDTPAGPDAIPSNAMFNSNVQSAPGPFYTPPSPLPNGLPGTVIKSEPIADAPPGLLAFRIMYLSTNANGNPTAVTGMVIQPFAVGPATGRPIVAFAHGTTGIGRECGISQAPFTPGTTGASMFDPRIRPLVDQGYVVTATDYEGEGAPGLPTYLVESTEAYNVLDSLRAAVYLEPQTVNASKMAIYGHSQGGHAALSAASLAASYAPELQLRGVVASAPGLVPALPLAIKTLVANPGTPKEAATRAAYILNIAASWSATFPDQFQASDVLTPEGIAALPLALAYCYGNLAPRLTEPFSTYVKSAPNDSLIKTISQNMPVTRRIYQPVLMMQGLADTDVSPPLTIAAAQALCQLGTTVALHTTANDTHETLIWSARPTELDWIAARFRGQAAPNTCGGQQ